MKSLSRNLVDAVSAATLLLMPLLLAYCAPPATIQSNPVPAKAKPTLVSVTAPTARPVFQGRFIVNTLSKKCIDVRGKPGTANESPLQLYDCEYSDSSTDQKWEVTSDGFIRNMLSRKCIDVKGRPGVANESPLQLWDCETSDSSTDQKWEFTKDGFIRNRLSGKCIDVWGKPGTANESLLQLWDCEFSDPKTDQRWQLQ
jgi:hypothetical protein